MEKFKGTIKHDIRDSTPDWTPYLEPAAHKGAPNFLYIVWDDMGYGSWDLYGGLIEMPNMRRIANMGTRFTQFHTTALCSPTRSCALTGRNATSNGMSVVGEMAAGFPNLHCVIPPENGMISEVLLQNGYNTFAVGKWHLSPAGEMSMGASKRTWPVQRGFERYYGFLGGLTDQWYPDLWYDNHQIDPPAKPKDGYHLSKDLADQALTFINDAKITAPGKPWMLYFAPGACHAPHHVFTEWSDKYKGKFDMGYEKYREEALERQKKMGLVPPDTVLPPINPLADKKSADGKPWPASDIVQPWDELSDAQKQLFIRQAEVYAGYASYTDHQVGRILDYLEQSGQLDNTLIIAFSDNGASAEGGPQGSVNENKWYNAVPEDLEENLKKLPELGLESTHPHYSNGWAMAFNTPFKMYKTNSSWEGGTADPMLIAWPKGLSAQGVVSNTYLHVTDLVPTVYDLLGITPPDTLRGAVQTPLEGVSMASVLKNTEAPSPKEEQFYSMLGTRSVWSKGWLASAVHAPTPSAWGHFDEDQWCLYHLEEDRNQMHDLAEEMPEKLKEMVDLWDAMAKKYSGYPLYDLSQKEILRNKQPNVAGNPKELTFYPGTSEVPEHVISFAGNSFFVDASFTIDSSPASGVIFSAGGRFGGYSLYLKDNILHFVYNWLGEKMQKLACKTPLPTGPVHVRFDFRKTGMDGLTPVGTATLRVNDAVVDSMDMRIQLGHFSLSGEGFNIGRDRGQPVAGEYEPPFAISGATIESVVLGLDDDGQPNVQKETEAAFHRD